MRPHHPRPGRALIGALVLTVGAATAVAAVDLPWRTIDGGGGTSSGGTFTLSGTIGQPDAGTMSGGTWTLRGGFHVGGADPSPPCPADLDDSGAVDFSDLVAVLSAWGSCAACAADLDGNGTVDFNDLVTVLAAWGPCA